MAIVAALQAFLDLTEDEIAAYAAQRAAALGLPLPEPTLADVTENLALLRAQSALFVAALSVAAMRDDPADTAAAFAP
jgi:hypothetical protein